MNGRRETVTFGKYGPADLSLARARELCIDAKRAIKEGRSPAIEKQRAKRRLMEAKAFGEFAPARQLQASACLCVSGPIPFLGTEQWQERQELRTPADGVEIGGIAKTSETHFGWKIFSRCWPPNAVFPSGRATCQHCRWWAVAWPLTQSEL